ncbi:MAG: hypothetical protein O3C68_04985 [Proteobacteria bacterium]|nr:hypothetical protein [Pseudomonadota bacterium]
MRWLLVLPILSLAACVTLTEAGIPDSWALPAYQTRDHCPAPVGVFSNSGTSNKPDEQIPTLASILFESQLQGFPVESVSFAMESGGELISVDGVLEGVPLNKPVQVTANGKSCATRWRRSSDTKTVNAGVVSQSVMWTGGLIIPIRETNHVTLLLAADGALLVNLDVAVWILGALMPVKITHTYWLRFELVSRVEA